MDTQFNPNSFFFIKIANLQWKDGKNSEFSLQNKSGLSSVEYLHDIQSNCDVMIGIYTCI